MLFLTQSLESFGVKLGSRSTFSSFFPKWPLFRQRIATKSLVPLGLQNRHFGAKSSQLETLPLFCFCSEWVVQNPTAIGTRAIIGAKIQTSQLHVNLMASATGQSNHHFAKKNHRHKLTHTTAAVSCYLNEHKIQNITSPINSCLSQEVSP